MNLPEKNRDRHESLSDLISRPQVHKRSRRTLEISGFARTRRKLKHYGNAGTGEHAFSNTFVIKAVRMFEYYLFGGLSYFRQRITNAIAGGLNSKIDAISKMV